MGADTNLFFRLASAGNLTGDETSAALDLGPMTQPMWVWLKIPTASGAGDTIDAKLLFCDSGGNTVDILAFKQLTNVAQVVRFPFFTLQPKIKLFLDTTDAGGGINYGAVEAWVDVAGRYTG